ncbi:MAG: alpha-amylase [Bacteroidetes bacterium]|nr:alpha-amylase [Bacteroidota bacterium]
MRRYRLMGIALLLLFLAGFSACRKPLPNPITPRPDPVGYTQYGIPFQAVPNAEQVVMYEVNLRALGPNPNLQGVIQKLTHIKSLGTNVLWLMPIYPVGQLRGINSPYCVRDYKSVGAEYGTMADLRTLTDSAHALGMAVILDWVANHTAWDHPWMANDGWYTTNASGDVIHPPGTNWQDVADLNFNNADMRRAMQDAMKYWLLEANVDGFRCDYADGVPFEFWQETWLDIRSIPNRNVLLLAEGSRADHFLAGFDLAFSWQWYNALKQVYAGQSVQRLVDADNQEYQNAPAGTAWLRFTTNHDESAWDATPVGLFGGIQGALAASAATFALGGAPLMYSSQEMGTTGRVPFFSISQLNWSANPVMLTTYRTILGFYATHPLVRTGTRSIHPHPDLLSVHRSGSANEIWWLVNLRNQGKTMVVPTDLRGTNWNEQVTNSTIQLSDSISLAPYQIMLLHRNL